MRSKTRSGRSSSTRLQADDGWTSVKYRGELLKTYRPKKQPASDAAEGDAGGSAAPRRKKARKAPARYTESDEDEPAALDEVGGCAFSRF